MGNIINLSDFLNNRKEYEKEIEETLDILDEFQLHLFTSAINLAVADKWKDWSDKMPDGSTFKFEDSMLFDTGDQNVTRIMELRDSAINLMHYFEKISDSKK